MDIVIDPNLAFRGNAAICYKVGANAAIVHNKIAWHIDQNKKRKHHYLDGHYWTYNTIDDLAKELPYLSVRSIRTAVEKLKKEGLVITGIFNKKGWDRTTWYTIPDDVMDTYYYHLSKSANGEVSSALEVSVPSVNTDISICQNRQSNTSTLPNTSPLQRENLSYRKIRESEGVSNEVKYKMTLMLDRWCEIEPRYADDVDAYGKLYYLCKEFTTDTVMDVYKNTCINHYTHLSDAITDVEDRLREMQSLATQRAEVEEHF